jgi:hypothetical protein
MMIRNDSRKSRFVVLTAAVLVLLLAGLLAARVVARSSDGGRPVVSRAPASGVPLPTPFALTDLPTPFCWGCSWNQDAPLQFQIDLDMLAPLGDGTANAATWFAEFAEDGARADARRAYQSRRSEFELSGTTWNVLPGNDPLLLEAEPWIDQAECRFYPELFQLEGIDTRLPNLLMMLDLARSWVYRGRTNDNLVAASEDFRRAIRLGRLLRQDDVTIIQDLVAIACIRLGAEALYEQARQEGDAATMAATSLVLADKDAMRLMTVQRISASDHAFRIDTEDPSRVTLQISDAELERIVRNVEELDERRFRLEALIGIHVVRTFGTERQRATARELLDRLADDPSDPLVAEFARHARDVEFDEEALRTQVATAH